jgi:glyoxylase-like metal-dependent hydrolase (beta-lactamase superfamily II)
MRTTVLAPVCAVALAIAPAAHEPDEIHAAADALDARTIKTLQFSASGATFTVGQNFAPSDPWPRVTVKRYTALINYEAGSMRQDLVREMGATMPRGGGVPFTSERRQIQAIGANDAWNVPIPPDPSAGSLPAAPCTPPEAGGTAPMPTPAPDSRAACLVMLWSTPQGFVKAAIANHATTKPVEGGTQVSFTIDAKYKMTGIINAQHQVARVQTWIDQSIVGAMLVDTEYSDYKDFGGIQFPAHIRQKEDGFPSLDLTVASVTPNVAADITAPESVHSAPPAPPIMVKSQQLADGVFWLTGGTHHSLAVAMKDHIVLVDTPNGEARALAVIAKAKDLIPGKPIRYVIAMHHHWDHLGGIRTAIDEGATIVSHETNKTLLERAATAPHTINPDRLSKSRKPLHLQTVGAEATMSDGTRTIKLYTMTGFEHTSDMLLVYLPQEKILAEADAYTPPETPTTPLIPPKVPYAAALYDNVQRLKLDARTIAPFHGARTADLTEVARQAGRRIVAGPRQ